ncbi:MAG: glycogen synthase GlgA [Acidobacteria bacterium]|nr:glycogen synthase GlgA [Acidobacteriota bacterium]
MLALQPPEPLSIVMVGSEAAPYAKTGGLGDVLGALPRALGRLGHRVTVLLPRYRGISAGERLADASIPMGGRLVTAVYYVERLHERVEMIFVDCPEFFDRDGLYTVDGADYPDNPARFGFLSRAALELLAQRDEPTSVLHTHDWQAGLLPVYLRRLYHRHARLDAVPVVFTIHNLAYQGLADEGWLPALDLGPDVFLPGALDSLEYFGQVSFLKGGVGFSDALSTVSPRYAIEIQSPEYGCGFEGILRARAADLVGILNGIDYDEWDPRRDRFLPEPYDACDFTGKEAAKREVLRRFGLPSSKAAMARPLVGMISRLVDQKGFDLVEALAGRLTGLDASIVVLGNGEARYEDMWRALAGNAPERIAAHIGFDEARAHLIEGGADIFLMPSRYEPCGLNQMYSLRYGTIPVVRATGGLDDTVEDFDPISGRGNGFKFAEPTPEALLSALERALATYRNRAHWRRIQEAGMRGDYSWDASAQKYVELYRNARRHAPGNPDAVVRPE